MDLGVYTPEHRLELEKLLDSPAWKKAISSGLVEEAKSKRIEPSKLRPFIDTVSNQLFEFNEERVKELVNKDNISEDVIVSELAKWPENLDGKDPIISFLGLNVTPECNFKPKCIYCNQPYIEPKVDLQGWKDIIAESTSNVNGAGPYIYITGGEPLILGEMIWGDDGLIRFATERGAGVNVNTNASLITPEVALYFIKSGLSRLHISLDTPDKDMQNYLLGGDRFDIVMEGIYNIQIARDLVGVGYPIVHTNCVLTNKNLEHFPSLFAYILEKHKQTGDKGDPFFNDMFMHVIPVGGASNNYIRPTAEEFKKFYTEIWDTVSNMWDEYQEKMGIEKDKRGSLFGYFSNPFLRVKHEGGLEAYAKISAEGVYGSLALSKYCYVAPTQAAFTPEGDQYRCGAHAIRHALPIGNINERGVFDNIKAGIPSTYDLPKHEYCDGCALATLYINQAVESKLKEKAKALISGAEKTQLSTEQNQEIIMENFDGEME
jgi:MoaA/NifB/PqqE/SkfB family radical SAM enzyme